MIILISGTQDIITGIPYDGNDPEFKDLYFETHDNHSFTYPKDPPEYWPKEWSDRLKDWSRGRGY